MTPYAHMLLAYVRPEAQGVYAYEYDRYAKDQIVALVLTIFFGIIGGEAYYIGNWQRGLWMTIALFSGVGMFISVPLWIARCFTIQGECEVLQRLRRVARCESLRFAGAGRAAAAAAGALR